MFSGSKQRVKF